MSMPDAGAGTGKGSGEEFSKFVRIHWSSLMTIAVAVSGSRADAEDLVQNALTSAYPRWQQIAPDGALAYLRRSILNANITRWRRHRGELPMANPPHGAVNPGTGTVDDRLTLLPLVRALPARQRAVLVLRYLGDISDADIAATLGITQATVRSQAKRGLDHLRQHQAGSPDTGNWLATATEAL